MARRKYHRTVTMKNPWVASEYNTYKAKYVLKYKSKSYSISFSALSRAHAKTLRPETDDSEWTNESLKDEFVLLWDAKKKFDNSLVYLLQLLVEAGDECVNVEETDGFDSMEDKRSILDVLKKAIKKKTEALEHMNDVLKELDATPVFQDTLEPTTDTNLVFKMPSEHRDMEVTVLGFTTKHNAYGLEFGEPLNTKYQVRKRLYSGALYGLGEGSTSITCPEGDRWYILNGWFQQDGVYYFSVEEPVQRNDSIRGFVWANNRLYFYPSHIFNLPPSHRPQYAFAFPNTDISWSLYRQGSVVRLAPHDVMQQTIANLPPSDHGKVLHTINITSIAFDWGDVWLKDSTSGTFAYFGDGHTETAIEKGSYLGFGDYILSFFKGSPDDDSYEMLSCVGYINQNGLDLIKTGEHTFVVIRAYHFYGWFVTDGTNHHIPYYLHLKFIHGWGDVPDEDDEVHTFPPLPTPELITE